MTPKRWQDCKPFVAALLARGYLKLDARDNIQVCMSDGVYLYMYEAFCDGMAARTSP